MKSHLQDHKRILRIMQDAIDSASRTGSSGVGVEVEEQVVAMLVREFESHAEKFDNHYAEHLQSRGCK